MKTLFLFFLSLLTIQFSFAQDVLDDYAAEVCDCSEGIDFNQKKDMVHMAFGICILESAEEYKDDLKDQYKIDVTNMGGKDSKRLGELVGLRMATICPGTLMNASNPKNATEFSTSSRKIEYIEAEGVLQELVKEQFITLIVTEDSGRKYSFLWMDKFEGSYKLTADDKDLLGSVVNIEYEEVELFDPKISEYRKYKVIRGISFD